MQQVASKVGKNQQKLALLLSPPPEESCRHHVPLATFSTELANERTAVCRPNAISGRRFVGFSRAELSRAERAALPGVAAKIA